MILFTVLKYIFGQLLSVLLIIYCTESLRYVVAVTNIFAVLQQLLEVPILIIGHILLLYHWHFGDVFVNLPLKLILEDSCILCFIHILRHNLWDRCNLDLQWAEI